MRQKIFVAVLGALAAVGAVSCKERKSDRNRPAATDTTNRDRTAPDNTNRNAQDRGPTADNAVESRSDLDTTQKIRQAVVDDESLSTDAHNVKIIVKDGTVTLKGPVASPAERNKVERLAIAVVGDGKVINQLEIAK